MNTNSPHNGRVDRARLNEIAEQKNGDDLPESASWDEVTAISNALYEQIEEVITSHATETPLTQREAEVWILSTFYGEDSTHLTDEAVALTLAAPNSPFGVNQGTDGESEHSDLPIESVVKDCYVRAKGKYEQARYFVGANTYYNRDEVTDSPEVVWLDQTTIERLLSQGQPHETTLDDVVSRLLATAESRLTLAELSRAYLGTRGEENIAQIVLFEGTSDSTLWFRAYGNVMGELPEVITETDAIEVDGERYDFHFDEDPYWPADRGGLVTLYAADGIEDIESVPLDRGIKRVRDRAKEAVEQDGFASLAEQ